MDDDAVAMLREILFADRAQTYIRKLPV